MRSYLHCPAGPSQVDELLFPPLFCVVLVVVHPGLSLQVLVLPPWPDVVVVTNPVLFPFVLSARAALGTNANEIADANRRIESSCVMGSLTIEFAPSFTS